MEPSIYQVLKNDLLGGTAEVLPICDTSSKTLLRCLIRSASSSEIISQNTGELSDIIFISQHVQMATELTSMYYCGAVAFEVPLTVLLNNVDLYRAMSFGMLANELALKLHIILTDDMPEYEQSFLLAELGELVALGVDLIIDNITTADHIELAGKIISVVDEVRMDISEKQATSYIHLSALMSCQLTKKPKIGVILASGQELPKFSTTYQYSSDRKP